MIPGGTIGEILQHKGATVWSVGPDATVLEAIQVMADHNVGALVVLENQKLIGIISERDYTRKVALRGKSTREVKVREILSGKVISVTPVQNVADGLRLMTDHRVRHLPVLDGGKLVGIVSIGDLVNWVITTQGSTIRQLETYISGCPQ